MQASPLARLLLAAWVLLAGYASLYPFAGWRDDGAPALAFLSAGWPRYVTGFDTASNVAGYMPFGLLCVLALHPALRGLRAVLVAALSGIVLSLALETAQGFLPARDASNLDLVCNAAGTLAGALIGVVAAPALLDAGPLRRMRAALLQPGAAADLGLLLIGLWLLTQLNPAMLLFGAGDLRDLIALPAGPAQPPALFASIEAITAAANLVAVSLLLSCIVQPGAPLRILVIALALGALATKTAAFAILMRAEDVLTWATPGARHGLLAGCLVALVAVGFGRATRLGLAALLLMGATVLVNLAPPNPYLAAILRVWQQGHFLNFNGLTRVVTIVWPFVAIVYLVWIAARRERGEAG